MEQKSTGLQILLSVVILIFLIGLVIMIFSLFSGEIQTATDETITGSVAGESLFYTNGTGNETSVASLENVALENVVVEGCYEIQ